MEGIKIFTDLISKIICYDPEKRLTPSAALEHRFFSHYSIEKRYLDTSGSSRSSHTMITRSVSKAISTSFPERANEQNRTMEVPSLEVDFSNIRTRRHVAKQRYSNGN